MKPLTQTEVSRVKPMFPKRAAQANENSFSNRIKMALDRLIVGEGLEVSFDETPPNTVRGAVHRMKKHFPGRKYSVHTLEVERKLVIVREM